MVAFVALVEVEVVVVVDTSATAEGAGGLRGRVL